MDTKNEMGRVKKDETGMLNNFDATKKLMSVRKILNLLNDE